MEHALHLGAGHFMASIAPANPGGRDGGDEDNDEEFDIGDTVGKALALVSQVRSTPLSSKFILTISSDTEVSSSLGLF